MFKNSVPTLPVLHPVRGTWTCRGVWIRPEQFLAIPSSLTIICIIGVSLNLFSFLLILPSCRLTWENPKCAHVDGSVSVEDNSPIWMHHRRSSFGAVNCQRTQHQNQPQKQLPKPETLASTNTTGSNWRKLFYNQLDTAVLEASHRLIQQKPSHRRHRGKPSHPQRTLYKNSSKGPWMIMLLLCYCWSVSEEIHGCNRQQPSLNVAINILRFDIFWRAFHLRSCSPIHLGARLHNGTLWNNLQS